MSCSDQRNTQVPAFVGPIPEFNCKDVEGREVSKGALAGKRSVLFFPTGNADADGSISDLIEAFEIAENVKLIKIIFGDNVRRNWLTVNDDNTTAWLSARYENAFLVFFDDATFAGGCKDDTGKGNINISAVRKALYQYFFNIDDPTMVLESHRPESYINVQNVRELFNVRSNVVGTVFILFVNNFKVASNNKSILQVFQERLISLPDARGVVAVDRSYNQGDIGAIIHNFNLEVPIVVLSEGLQQQFELLYKICYTDKINVLFMFDDGDFTGSYYIYGNCDALEAAIQ